jgi:hypothetical protein
MPRSETIPIAADAGVVELKNSNAVNLTLQNTGETEIILFPGVGSTPPDISKKGLRLAAGSGFVGIALAKLFPGLAGANRIYGDADSIYGECYISHD